MLIDMLISSGSTYLKLISNHNSRYQVRYEMKTPSHASATTEPFGHNAITAAGNHLKMSFASLGMSDGNFKDGVLFFKYYNWFTFKRHMPPARRGAPTCSWWWDSKPGAWGSGYTINPDGGITRMVSHEGCVCNTGPFWQGTGGDLGSWLTSERASQEPLWVCWREGRAFPKVLKGMEWWRANPSVMAKFHDSPWERV